MSQQKSSIFSALLLCFSKVSEKEERADASFPLQIWIIRPVSMSTKTVMY